jgi:hypothetical protein
VKDAEGAAMRARPGIAAVTLIALILASGCIIPQGIPEKHLIPEDFVGWTEVRWEIPEAPPLPREEGYLVFRYSGTGRLETSSSPNEEGLAVDLYFYVRGEGLEKLPSVEIGADRRIWGNQKSFRIVRTDGELVEKDMRSRFFVGTEEQYKDALAEGNDGTPRVVSLALPRLFELPSLL